MLVHEDYDTTVEFLWSEAFRDQENRFVNESVPQSQPKKCRFVGRYPTEPPIFPVGDDSQYLVQKPDGKRVTGTLNVPSPKSKNHPVIVPKAVVCSQLPDGIGWLKVTMFPGAVGIDLAKMFDTASASVATEIHNQPSGIPQMSEGRIEHFGEINPHRPNHRFSRSATTLNILSKNQTASASRGR